MPKSLKSRNRAKKSDRRSKSKSSNRKSPVRKSKSPKRKSVRKSKSPKRKSPVRKSKSPKRKSVRKPKSPKNVISKSEKKFVKKLIESLKFSEEDIENLMSQHAPSKMTEKDGAIIKERLQNFVYDPSYESQFFNRDPKWSLEDSTYFQAAARLAEYGKGNLEANEI